MPDGAKRPRFLATVMCLAALAWGIGQVFRDCTYLTGLCFYLPTPIVLLASVGCAIRLRRQRSAAFWLAMTASAVFICHLLVIENRYFARPNQTAHATYRLMHWNVFRGYAGHDRLAAAIQQVPADIYVFSEVPDDFELAVDEFHQVRLGNMLVAANGPLNQPNRLETRDGLRLFSMTWQSPSGPIPIIVADMDSSIAVHRHPLLTELTNWIESERPSLIVGDLNAPRRSAALSELPSGYEHAYESCGSGWSATWPVPIPVYAIDQCIHDASVLPIRYELRSTSLSDHRQQIFEFAPNK